MKRTKIKNEKSVCLMASLLLLSSSALAESVAVHSIINDNGNKPLFREINSDPYHSNWRDTNITATLREDIMSDKELSPEAQNIQIITIDGKVLLTGQVPTVTEERRILIYARSIAGRANVLNKIVVPPVDLLSE